MGSTVGTLPKLSRVSQTFEAASTPFRVSGLVAWVLVWFGLSISAEFALANEGSEPKDDRPSTVEFSIIAKPRPFAQGANPFFRTRVPGPALVLGPRIPGWAGNGARVGAPKTDVKAIPLPFGRTMEASAGMSAYPGGGVQMRDGTKLSAENALFYGARRAQLSRGGTALKGADLIGSVSLFAGAMASSFGWLEESQALWLAGGAAALGAAYGVSVGFESRKWREEWRWPEEN